LFLNNPAPRRGDQPDHVKDRGQNPLPEESGSADGKNGAIRSDKFASGEKEKRKAKLLSETVGSNQHVQQMGSRR
jgi:hypothetical protein